MHKKSSIIIYPLFFCILLSLCLGIPRIYHPPSLPILTAVHTGSAESSGNVYGVSTSTESVTGTVPFELKDTVTILLIGLDTRRDGKTSRCDAIHLFTFDRKKKTLQITNIPRGTPLPIPGYDADFSIISNACAVFGIDTVRHKIEDMTGSPVDYMVTLGFSETVGIARLLNLPAMDTLTSLRSREYPTGDNQRSYNQALFLRDLIEKHLTSYLSFPKPFKYIAFNLVDTDMNFETADKLIIEAANSPFAHNSSLIPIKSYSSTKTPLKDIHLLSRLEISTISASPDKEEEKYQEDLIIHLQNLIEKSSAFLNINRKDQGFKIIKTAFLQKLWLQIDNEKDRDRLHFSLLHNYSLANPNASESSKLILDFITEMDQKGDMDLKKEGTQLLSNF